MNKIYELKKKNTYNIVSESFSWILIIEKCFYMHDAIITFIFKKNDDDPAIKIKYTTKNKSINNKPRKLLIHKISELIHWIYCVSVQ